MFSVAESIMKTLFAVTTTGALLLSGIASAEELPSYELFGFPITYHQIAVLGSANVKEQSPSTSLLVASMPASPHQVSVLTPRPCGWSIVAVLQNKRIGFGGFARRQGILNLWMMRACMCVNAGCPRRLTLYKPSS